MKLAALLALPLALSSSASAQTAYGLECGGGPFSVYEIDFGTGQTTPSWSHNVSLCDGSDNAPGTSFYGVSCTGDLFRIDMSMQTVAPLGFIGTGIAGLAYDPVGDILYGTDDAGLWIVDPGVPSASFVGTFGTPNNMWAFAYDAFRQRLIGADSVTDMFYEINTTNGSPTQIGPTGASRLTDLWVDPQTGRTFAVQNIPDEMFEIDPLTGAATLIGVLPALMCGIGALNPPDVGTSYCTPAVANSSGAPGSISASGSAQAAANALFLNAASLPSNQFGYFLVSGTQGFIANPNGSQGHLCLAAPIGRFVAQVQSSGAAGAMSMQPDLSALPLTPAVAVVAGDTWNFQCWYRDSNPGPTSNFTDAVSVTFN